MCHTGGKAPDPDSPMGATGRPGVPSSPKKGKEKKNSHPITSWRLAQCTELHRQDFAKPT